jgi:hypothetical protein
MKATKPPVRNAMTRKSIRSTGRLPATHCGTPETVVGNSTTSSAPSITVNKIGTLVPVRQPVLKHVAHGVPPPGPQPGVQLLAEFPELVADLDLGLAAGLLADGRPGRAKARPHGL